MLGGVFKKASFSRMNCNSAIARRFLFGSHKSVCPSLPEFNGRRRTTACCLFVANKKMMTTTANLLDSSGSWRCGSGNDVEFYAMNSTYA